MGKQLGKLTPEAAKSRMCLRAKIALNALGAILAIAGTCYAFYAIINSHQKHSGTKFAECLAVFIVFIAVIFYLLTCIRKHDKNISAMYKKIELYEDDIIIGDNLSSDNNCLQKLFISKTPRPHGPINKIKGCITSSVVLNCVYVTEEKGSIEEAFTQST